MSDFQARHPELTALFAARDLTPAPNGDWLVIDDVFPAIRVRIAGRTLSVDIALDADQQINELYPLDNGLDLFRDGSLAVLMSAFWRRHDPNVVLTEVVRRPDGPWRTFTGRYLRTVGTGERPPVPYALFDTVKAFLRDAPLDRDLHWLSTGVAVDGEEVVADIRLDGVRLPVPEAAIAAMDWLYDGRDYTLRNAILLVKS